MALTTSADRQRYWRKAIERQQASGQSIVGFCAKGGLSLASFHAWKRRLSPLDYFFGLDGAGTGCALGTLGGASASRTERSA
jgi:hypothetical protein